LAAYGLGSGKTPDVAVREHAKQIVFPRGMTKSGDKVGWEQKKQGGSDLRLPAQRKSVNSLIFSHNFDLHIFQLVLTLKRQRRPQIANKTIQNITKNAREQSH
jgi:hypothetical protein